MELQPTTEKQTFASRNASVAAGALLRLSLLVGPEAVVIKTLAHNPIVCLLAGVAVLALWFSVDIGPFRAKAPAKAAPAQTPVPQQARPLVPRLPRVQWWSYMCCKLIIVCAMFHSKMTI